MGMTLSGIFHGMWRNGVGESWMRVECPSKHGNLPSVLENITTEPHAQDISADLLRVWLSGYILEHSDMRSMCSCVRVCVCVCVCVCVWTDKQVVDVRDVFDHVDA